jgi:selenocysteine lyase/cysteine desulfurase
MLERENDCRNIAADLLYLKPDEISFTSSCAEAYNLLASCLDLKPQDEIVVTNLDFPSCVTPWLCTHTRPNLQIWHHKYGGLDVADVLPLLNKHTRLIQLPVVAYYNGYLLPWRQFVEPLRKAAPEAIIALDMTQALGRVDLKDYADADIIIGSTHTWALSIHGLAIVGIPTAKAERLRPYAGGWRHLQDPFGMNRFHSARAKSGAAGFGTGTPNFPAIYALNAALRYIQNIGLDVLKAELQPILNYLHESLETLGLTPLAPYEMGMGSSGIVAFKQSMAKELHAQMQQRGVEVQRDGQVLRISVHGYNTYHDVNRMLTVLDKVLP